jgi:hypothetical protein
LPSFRWRWTEIVNSASGKAPEMRVCDELNVKMRSCESILLPPALHINVSAVFPGAFNGRLEGLIDGGENSHSILDRRTGCIFSRSCYHCAAWTPLPELWSNIGPRKTPGSVFQNREHHRDSFEAWRMERPTGFPGQYSPVKTRKRVCWVSSFTS